MIFLTRSKMLYLVDVETGENLPTFLGSIPSSANDVSAPAANTAAIVTYSGVVGKRHVVTGVAWSYSNDPTGGKVIITDGIDTIFDITITSAGAGFIPFPGPKRGSLNTSMVITLPAVGSGISGKLSILNHWEE